MFASWIDHLRRRQAADWDNIIVVDGEEGSGKSNMGLNIALALEPGFDPARIIYDHQDFGRVVTTARNQVIFIDEGGNLGFSRDWNVGENKALVKFVMLVRQLNPTIILCIPNIHWLDKYFREHRVKYRVHMVMRERALVQERVQNWRHNTTRFEDWFAVIPSNLRRTAPVFWASYTERKRQAFVDGRSDAPPRRSYPAAAAPS